MPNILVRDLPENVHAELQRRAEQHGQSLQQFLATELTRIAERPSLEELLDRIDRHEDGHVGGRVSLRQAAADIRGERDRR
jgi:antitoxin FitA